MQKDPQVLAEIHAVLELFQQGYTRRDPDEIENVIRLFAADEDLEVIGTNASGVERAEWCIGPAMVRELLLGDWEGWGDVRLALPDARISHLGNVAWLSVPGTVTMDFNAEQAYADYLEYIGKLIVEEGRALDKLLRIQLGAASTLYELGRGEHFVWPFVLTAVLVKQDEGWRFHQMRFGFPTTRYPDERILG